MDGRKLAETGAWTSVLAYGLLTAVKLAVGAYADSASLTADGLNNLTDVAASMAVLVGLRISGKPRDADHPYGHSRAEHVATLVTSFIMASVGVQVLWTSLPAVIRPEAAPAPDVPALWTAIATAGVMFGVHLYNRRLAERTGSMAIRALAKDNLADAAVSAGVVIGIAGARLGLPWLDPFVALIIGLLICRTAVGIFLQASHVVTDGFDPKKLDKYRSTVLGVAGVAAVTDMKARFQGNDIIVEVTVEVDPGLTVADSHQIADAIEERMLRKHAVKTTLVHVEPYAGA